MQLDRRALVGCFGRFWDLCRVRVGLLLLLAAAVNLVPCDPALMLCVCPLVCVRVCVCMWCGSLDRGRREVLMSCCSKMNVVLLSLVCVLQCARFRMRVLVGGGKARTDASVASPRLLIQPPVEAVCVCRTPSGRVPRECCPILTLRCRLPG